MVENVHIAISHLTVTASVYYVKLYNEKLHSNVLSINLDNF
jgi:hypothetical protein